MISNIRILISSVAMIMLGASTTSATVYNVSTSASLQTALDTAVPGDEIVLADGSYSGKFYIRNNSGTASKAIVVRAGNRHKAIMQGNNACDRSQEAFVIQRSGWVVKDLRFRDHGRAISIYASNVEIGHNIIDHFREEGIRVEGTSGAYIHDNVIAFGDGCTSTAPGIFLVNNADNNRVINNIIFATGDNGYAYGTKGGYGMLIANNSDDNLVQGNLLFANGGKGVFRILSGVSLSSSADRNKVYDNAFLWGEGENSSNDCSDDSNEFNNNIMYSVYQFLWNSKGNKDGTKGNHLLKHNLFWIDAFTRMGVSFINGADCDGPIPYKVGNIVQDNVFYSPDRTSDFHTLLWADGQGAIKQSGHNLIWASGASSTWTKGYPFNSTDIYSATKPPIFNNAGEGDFSLSAESPGRGAASDGKDIGVEYNAYLKKSWLRNAFMLPKQQLDNLGTNVSFTVNPAKYYQVWFYVPLTDCNCIENFSVEGQSITREINGLTSGNTWIQPGGPARWITLGRHRAADGKLNISWGNSASAEKIFIRELPTADEVYGWISGISGGSGGSVLPSPTGLIVSTTP